jgi:hypothetical protein
VSDLVIAKRWLGKLREACKISKWKKQARVESAIFNFLSIQRKGFNSLIENA